MNIEIEKLAASKKRLAVIIKGHEKVKAITINLELFGSICFLDSSGLLINGSDLYDDQKISSFVAALELQWKRKYEIKLSKNDIEILEFQAKKFDWPVFL